MCSIVTTNNVRRTSEVSGFSISCIRQIGQGVEQNWLGYQTATKQLRSVLHCYFHLEMERRKNKLREVYRNISRENVSPKEIALSYALLKPDVTPVRHTQLYPLRSTRTSSFMLH